MVPEKGQIYIAPGNHHLCFKRPDFSFKLFSSLPENFLRPSADPLFRSAAHTFGPYGIGVVLSGPTSDGSRGAKMFQEKSGTILIQDPTSAIAPFMPKSAIQTVDQYKVVSLDRMSTAITDSVKAIHKNLIAYSN
jgi:two-component system chemotaxis response regulator CheB